MSDNQTDINEIERNIRHNSELMNTNKVLQRLMKNRDFRLIVLEGYFKEEAIRLVHLKSDSNMQTEDKQKALLTQVDAIGALSGYFQTIAYLADQASKANIDNEQTREELMNEEMNDD